jgi:hypothetical protein
MRTWSFNRIPLPIFNCLNKLINGRPQITANKNAIVQVSGKPLALHVPSSEQKRFHQSLGVEPLIKDIFYAKIFSR